MESSLPPPHPSFKSSSEYQPLTVKDWIITNLVMMIPVIGFIMIFVWAFTEGTHPSKRSFFQAILIIWGTVLVLGIGVFLLFMLLGLAAASVQ